MFIKYNIIVIGCGGTGGNFIKELGRFFFQNDLRHVCAITLVDGDVVEKRNIARQPFLEEDVGRNKAEVMAEILQGTFELDCCFYPDYINHVSDLKKFEKKDAMMILIASVDNHACRKILHEYFLHTESCNYLDAANEYSVGEVVVGVRIADTEISPDRIYYYPEILEDVSVPKSEESCQNINVSQPQHLVTNLFAANILLKCTIEIVSGDEWAGGIYYFDAFKQFLKFKEMPE